MPSGLSLPLAFGIYTRLIGSGRYFLLLERKRQFTEPSLNAVRLDILKVLVVHARCALVRAALRIGMRQDVLAVDLGGKRSITALICWAGSLRKPSLLTHS
jgi:hypothetical protein